MTQLQDAAKFAQDPEARLLVAGAIVKAAVDVAAEADTTPNHTNRVNLANKCLRSPASMIEPFVWAISTNSAITTKWVDEDQAGVSDDLAYVMGTLWDAMANANGSPSL